MTPGASFDRRRDEAIDRQAPERIKGELVFVAIVGALALLWPRWYVLVPLITLLACSVLGPKPAPRFFGWEPARTRLERAAPDATWRWDGSLSVNLDGDGVPDIVVLGTAGSVTVVGVVLGAVAKPWVTRLTHGDGQADTCAPPVAMSIEAQPCHDTGAPPFCSPPSGQPAADPALEEVRLEGGGCAPFHFYFDGAEVIWWRA